MLRRVLFILASTSLGAAAQISNVAIATTATQAIVRYTSPVPQACSLKIADMYRGISIQSATQSGGTVTVMTVGWHGLLPGAVVYLEKTGIWDGWQTVTGVGNANSFTFSSVLSGTASAGNAGVLVDDVNPMLFAGADQDSRNGSASRGRSRVVIVGRRTAALALDGNRYSRALQTNARHHLTITCGTQNFDQEFITEDAPLGDTHNEGLPVDRDHPGQYAYPTIQWGNRAQALIDPLTGMRSFRATGPTGAASTNQSFQTAIDAGGVWSNPSGPLTSGTATFSGGSCNSGTCPLFLRADNLSLNGGATYTTADGSGSSLDWVQVTLTKASIGNASCRGDDCKIDACLTVNGVTCSSANQEVQLTSMPSTYTLGTRNMMDLWQGSGAPLIARPDVSKASGTVNYTSATNTLTWASGNFFNIKWTAGSRMMVAGSEYSIASVVNERQIILASGPTGNLSAVPYSANNFGVLIWKKTATADQISVGGTTYQYGTSTQPSWNSYSVNGCGADVTAGSVTGNDCFIGQELYWVAKDGSDLRDLGLVQTYYNHPPVATFRQGGACGGGTAPDQFDPTNGDAWYCLYTLNYDGNWISLVRVQYMGNHAAVAPGTAIADCDLNNNTQPCIKFTILQPNKSDAMPQSAAAFSPQYQASPLQAGYWIFNGISSDGDVLIQGRGPQGQDSPSWIFIYTLGDGTPAGTGPNSVRPVAAISSFLTPPMSYCVLHSDGTPMGGWAQISLNDMSHGGASWVYKTTLTSGSLNVTAGAPGGLNSCPANPFGVAGQKCTDITISGDPTRSLDGTALRSIQVGDVILVDSEYMRVVAKSSDTALTVQRGYVNTAASHAGSSLSMYCGAQNALGAKMILWNYRGDPYGTNATGTTVQDAWNMGNGHGGVGPGLLIYAPTGWWDVGQTLCPQSIFGSTSACYEIFRATYATFQSASMMTVAGDAPFAGKLGLGGPNTVDSHPGPCVGGAWCLDARPMDGGQGIGSSSSPFVNVQGQLWKATGAQTAGMLNRKFLATMAYAGRFSLVDVSGPSSSIGGGAADSYKYCYALAAGECVAGSGAGDLYVNAPFISAPYCSYPGIAIQGDDSNMICITDLGSSIGNMMQIGTMREDLQAAYSRRLGPMYSRWNQHNVYWNAQSTPSGGLVFSNVRWLDEVRDDDLITILPPMPTPDAVARNTFVGVPVRITPPAGQGIDNAIVEFGYAENGDPGSFYCTSRQEACVAAANSIDSTNPFFFEQTEHYSGAKCIQGCSVLLPGLPQHVLYYRWKYRDSSGNAIATSAINAIAVP